MKIFKELATNLAYVFCVLQVEVTRLCRPRQKNMGVTYFNGKESESYLADIAKIQN